MRLTAWRVALRIARRDALRAKGRSALVIAMIALPVLGVAGIDVVFRSAQLEPEQRITRTMGEADATVSGRGQGIIVSQAPNPDDGSMSRPAAKGQQPTAEQTRSKATMPGELITQLLPAGARLVPLGSTEGTTATTASGQLKVGALEADLTDSIWHGRINLTGGRAPAAAQELAATDEFLRTAGLRIGDTTTLRGLEGKPFTITASVEYPDQLKESQLLVRPGSLPAPPAEQNHPRGKGSRGGDYWLVKLPAGAVLDWPKVLELNKYGFAIASRAVLLDPPPRSEVPFFADQEQYSGGFTPNMAALAVVATVAGMALLEIVLLAGPAFAVGARRSRRQLGLLAAGGGDRSHVRSVVLGGGVVLGLAGAVTGVVLAVLAVAVARPWLEDLAGSRFGSFDLAPLDLAGVAAIGLVTGLLAAVVPAVQASRQDVVSALTGRGSIKPPNRKLALLGLLMLGGGAAIALLAPTLGGQQGKRGALAVLGGSVIAELGMVACTPMLVGLFGRLGRWLPLSPRLALRDSVRHRGRTAPAVAAVMAAVAGSVAVGIYAASQNLEHRQDYQATLRSGAVLLDLGYGESDAAQFPARRDALERIMPNLGPRGEIFEARYAASSRGGPGGYMQLQVPADLRCPLYGPERTEEPTEAEYQRFRNDPRCLHPAGSYSSAFSGPLLVGDTTALGNLTGVRDPAAAAALAEGKVLVFNPDHLRNGKATFTLTDAPPELPDDPSMADQGEFANVRAVSTRPKQHDISVEAVLFEPELRNAGAFATPETARRLGLTVAEAGTVWQPSAMPSSENEQQTEAALAKLGGDGRFTVERGYQEQDSLIILGLTAFAAIVALGAAGIATGLAAADSQRDLGTLAAVGATSGIRRRLSGFQCGVIAAMGTVLGTISGVVPAIALRIIESTPQYPGDAGRDAVIAVPWPTLGLTLLVLPVVAVLLAMLFTRSRPALLRRSV
ncbi:FtsX-like permease family protein [Kitasatospora sp. P5_F3]